MCVNYGRGVLLVPRASCYAALLLSVFYSISWQKNALPPLAADDIADKVVPGNAPPRQPLAQCRRHGLGQLALACRALLACVCSYV